MMEFLDTVRNRKDDPERELRPRAAGALHARRQGPRAGNANYTQDDIVQIARAFTGWRLRRQGRPAFLDDDRHDFTSATSPSAARR